MDLPENSVRIDYGDGYYIGTVKEGTDTEDGYGIFVWNTGEMYAGEFRDGVRTGKGRLVLADGSVYEGDFLNNMRSGKGTMTWPSGEVYEGDFIDNSRSGKGKVTWPSGDWYEGDFIDGKMEGHGTYYSADGSVKYSGQWIQSCPVDNS